MQEVRYTLEIYQLEYNRVIQNKNQNDFKAAKGEGVRKYQTDIGRVISLAL